MGLRVADLRDYPLRRVTNAELRSGKPILSHMLNIRWWNLVLECGHVEERGVRYKPGSHGKKGYALMHQLPDVATVLPAPKRVRCSFCPRRKK